MLKDKVVDLKESRMDEWVQPKKFLAGARTAGCPFSPAPIIASCKALVARISAFLPGRLTTCPTFSYRQALDPQHLHLAHDPLVQVDPINMVTRGQECRRKRLQQHGRGSRPRRK